MFIEKADKLSVEFLRHQQRHCSIGMVHLSIRVTLGRQMSEPTILFFKYFYWMERKPESYNRDLKLFPGGHEKNFYAAPLRKPPEPSRSAQLLCLAPARSSELTGRGPCGMPLTSMMIKRFSTGFS